MANLGKYLHQPTSNLNCPLVPPALSFGAFFGPDRLHPGPPPSSSLVFSGWPRNFCHLSELLVPPVAGWPSHPKMAPQWHQNFVKATCQRSWCNLIIAAEVQRSPGTAWQKSCIFLLNQACLYLCLCPKLLAPK